MILIHIIYITIIVKVSNFKNNNKQRQEKKKTIILPDLILVPLLILSSSNYNDVNPCDTAEIYS